MHESDESATPPPRPGIRPRHRRRFASSRRGPLVTLGVVAALAGVLLTVTVVREAWPGQPAAGGATGVPSGSPTPDPGTPGPAASEPADAGPGHRLVPPSVRRSACPAFPEFPDENCTGYRHTGVVLRECPNVIEQDGLQLDGCRFSRDLIIQASDVTITRSLVDGTVFATYLTEWSLGGLTLIDVEINGGGRVVDGRTAAIGDHDYTCIRCHIHSSERGANLGHNIHIEDSYLHDFIQLPGSHQTAVGSNGGANLTLLHNNMDCESDGSCSAALALYPDFEPIEDVLVQNNLFNTNGSYCTYGGFDNGTHIRYIDNVFGTKYYPECGAYGPVAAFETSAQGNLWRGNRYPDGTEIDPQSDV